MSQPQALETLPKEARILMALFSLEKREFQSLRGAAKAFHVPEATLRWRRAGKPAIHDCVPKSKLLSQLEEKAVIEHVLEASERGFSITIRMVRDIANSLLATRDAPPVGVNWPSTFVKRVPELRTRVNRRYDYKRALMEDPEVMRGWFRLVQNTINKYGIPTEDIFNFDETGFQIGVITPRLVITGSERRQAPKSLQPGNKEWVTSITAVCADGWAVPPFIIFKGKQHYNTWYEAIADRPKWVLSVSEKGWTSVEHGFEWLKHFDLHTKNRRTSTYRLLIMDGHNSHESVEFRDYCKDSNIITLCMPPHASHLLQPLDVGCFAPLKRFYGNEIDSLMRLNIQHIEKEDFLTAFKTAFDKAITPLNIKGGFRGTGLVPLDPEAVISKLDIRFTTPPPPPPESRLWESQTPRTAFELQSQTDYVRQRVRRHQDSSPSSMFESLESLAKGASMIAHGASIMQMEIGKLRKANEELTKRKQRKKKAFRGSTTRRVETGLQMVAELQNSAVEAENSDGGVKSRRRCGICREIGHRRETCSAKPVETPTIVLSDRILN